MKYGLIGYPLGHSYSEKYFNSKFEKDGIDSIYTLYPIESIDRLPSLIRTTDGLRGLNVTIPYKEEVIKYLNVLSEDAREIGAVNVIKIVEGVGDGEKTLTGYNTDYIGFSESLKPLLDEDVRHALILGTGGASKAVAYALGQLGIEYKFVSRTPGKGRLGYGDLNENVIRESRLIVNTTPVGMYPKVDNAPDIPYSFLGKNHICYDLVYNPESTLFMKLAAERGATVKNGLEMLKLQADAAWKIWNA